MISGEWAVLEVGNPCIVAAINKRVFVEIEKSDRISITLPEFGIDNLEADFDGDKLIFSRELSEKEQADVLFIKGAIETTLKYLGSDKTFRIKSWGEDTQVEIAGEIKKVGFGSSAAAVVATVGAILAFHGEDISQRKNKDKIYKLSAAVHYLAQGKLGSAFDVAASTYGGVLVYQRFDPKWLLEQFEGKKSLQDIINSEWKAFKAEPLELPENLEFLVGWTKDSASTSAMVKQINSWRDEGNQDLYKQCYDNIANLVRELISEWKNNNHKKVLELLRKNEDLLRDLGQKSGVNIETKDLNKLSSLANESGAAGKLSGAGGGDCGIAICYDSETAEKVKQKWEENDIYLIDVTIDKNGVKV